MKRIVWIAIAVAMGGCSTFDEASYMPSETQLQVRNPALMNCPDRTPPVCETWGGRTNKRIAQCRCGL